MQLLLINIKLSAVIQSSQIRRNLYWMKEKFWKQLKSKLCPREKWIKDQEITKCQCCTLEFTFLRRRHHCRFCGKLFCNNCSNVYINGNYLGLSEKYVRHCSFCKQQIEKIKRDLNRLTYMVEQQEDIIKQQDEDEQSGSSSEEDNEYFSFKVIFGSLEKQGSYQFSEELDSKIKDINKKLLKMLIQMSGINSQFFNTKLLELLSRAIIQCKMDILPRDLNSKSNYMDISKYISIKTIFGDPGQVIDFVKGVVLEKNLPIKRMLNRLIKPQILIFQNSLDEGMSKIKFEDLIQNQKAIIDGIQDSIMKFNPDIIFIEKTINRQILDYLSENGIAVISGLKKKDIAKIMHISGIRSTIKNVWNISKYNPNYITGKIDLMYIKIFDKNSEPIIYFQKNIGVYTFVISQKTIQSQNILKKNLQLLIKLMRQINLEKYLIYVDFEMWEDKNYSDIPRLYRLNPNYIANLQKMKLQEISFFKIKLSDLEISKEDNKKIKEYCKLKNHFYYLENCGDGTLQNITSYSQGDCTIGHFLLIMATTFVKKCSSCNVSHRERYYFEEHGVQISIKNLRQQGQKQRQEIHDEQDLTIQKMHKYLKRYKENSNIFSYFQCKNCSVILSKRVKIGKNYLKNSFNYFLYLITNSEEWPMITRLKSQKISSKSSKECSHPAVERILETSDTLFRMQVFSIHKYTISSVDLKLESSRLFYESNLKRYISTLMRKQVEKKMQSISYLLTLTNNYIFVLNPFRNQHTDHYKIIIELEKMEKIQQILKSMEEYTEEIWKKQSLKEITQTTDWTFFTRQIAKIDFVLREVIQTLQTIEGNLYKRKKTIEGNQMTSVYENQDGLIQTIDALQNHEQASQSQSMMAKDKIYFEEESDYTLKLSTSKENQSQLQLPRTISHNSQKQQFLKYQKQDRNSLKSQSKKAGSINFSLIQNQNKFKLYLQQINRRRYQLKKGLYLYFNLVNYKQPISILVCTLNSLEFNEQFGKKSPVHFKFNLVMTKEIPTSWDLKQKIEKIRNDLSTDEVQSRDSYEVIVHHHRQFQQFREMQGLTYETYIKSLANCEFWDTSGGKSKSQFAKSQDQILVVKTIKEEEFVQFQKFASDYLKHVKRAKSKNQNSFLAKIYGIYQLTVRGTSYKCVVMQNLFFGLEDSPLKIYDLKGSQVNRLQLPPKGSEKKFTGLDTNFKIDKNYHPYIFQQSEYTSFFQILQDDISFLSKNEVIDYSLLVIQNNNDLRIGIIDFMRPYHFKEKVEKRFKELKYGMEPTVLPPQEYANRFLCAMRKYFIGINR